MALSKAAMFLPIWRVSAFLASASGRLFLRHERADLLGDAIAGGFPLLGLRQQLAALLVERKNLVNFGLIPRPPRGQALADQVGLFANQFDIKHRRIIGGGKSKFKEQSLPRLQIGAFHIFGFSFLMLIIILILIRTWEGDEIKIRS